MSQIAAHELRCPYCNEPWVASEHPLKVGGKKVSARPNCDCYWEAHPDVTRHFVIHHGERTAYPVDGLKDEHRPPQTAQEHRRIEDMAWEQQVKEDMNRRQREFEKAVQDAGLAHLLGRGVTQAEAEKVVLAGLLARRGQEPQP